MSKSAYHCRSPRPPKPRSEQRRSNEMKQSRLSASVGVAGIALFGKTALAQVYRTQAYAQGRGE